MSQMAPEPGIGGGMSKPLGVPWFVWIGGAAILAYFLFFRNSGASPAGSATTGGAVTTGATTLDKGAVTINITQQSPNDPADDKDVDKDADKDKDKDRDKEDEKHHHKKPKHPRHRTHPMHRVDTIEPPRTKRKVHHVSSTETKDHS